MGKKKARNRGQPRQLSIHDDSACKIINDLWLLLQNESSEQLVSLWDEYDRMQVLVCRLRELQGTQHVMTNRAEKITDFERWLEVHGAVYTENLKIIETASTGFGLQCLKDLKCDDKVLQIPESVMMSSQTAFSGTLGALLRKDYMLKSMTNIALALHLLNEKNSPNSFWKPYIDILPQSFSLPLYFSKEELLLLQGSPCLVKCLVQIRNMTKLYSHLHRLIRTAKMPSLPLVESGFTYDDFIWAVACVMSRQNEIPAKPDLPSPNLALIPLWDLCNHCSGHISTYFNAESSTCDCYAQQDFKATEEFKIFYGKRTNLELFLQQGFVYPQNECDSYALKLGISSLEDDTTRTRRLQLLQAINLPISGLFDVTKSRENPFSPELCAFVRIFTAQSDKLEKLFSDKNLLQIEIQNTEWKPDDLCALEFLDKRCSLLLLQYSTTVENDEKLLQTGSASTNSNTAILMRLCEKKILTDAISYAKIKLQQVTLKE